MSTPDKSDDFDGILSSLDIDALEPKKEEPVQASPDNAVTLFAPEPSPPEEASTDDSPGPDTADQPTLIAIIKEAPTQVVEQGTLKLAPRTQVQPAAATAATAPTAASKRTTTGLGLINIPGATIEGMQVNPMAAVQPNPPQPIAQAALQQGGQARIKTQIIPGRKGVRNDDKVDEIVRLFQRYPRHRVLGPLLSATAQNISNKISALTKRQKQIALAVSTAVAITTTTVSLWPESNEKVEKPKQIDHTCYVVNQPGRGIIIQCDDAPGEIVLEHSGGKTRMRINGKNLVTKWVTWPKQFDEIAEGRNRQLGTVSFVPETQK